MRVTSLYQTNQLIDGCVGSPLPSSDWANGRLTGTVGKLQNKHSGQAEPVVKRSLDIQSDILPIDLFL